MRRVVMWALVMAMIGAGSNRVAGQDRFAWRGYLNPSEFKEWSTLIDLYTQTSVFVALRKSECKLPAGIDSEDRFLDLLKRMSIVRPGAEEDVPRAKYRAWVELLSPAPSRCNQASLQSEIEAKQRWYNDFLQLQVKGLKRMSEGGRKYR